MAGAAIITGASSGIGRALAIELARSGRALGLTARRMDRLEDLRREIGGIVPIELRALDVRDTAAVGQVIPELAAALGDVDLIVANAGIAGGRAVGTGHFATDRDIIETNVLGAMATIDAAAALFRTAGRGHIVGISSVAGFRGLPGSAAYCASKAALSIYLESARVELHGLGILVTTISPGFIDTPINEDLKTRPFVIKPEVGARKIAALIESGTASSTVPKFPWGLYGVLMRFIPDALWTRLATLSPGTGQH